MALTQVTADVLNSSQGNITHVGTLDSLSVNGDVTVGSNLNIQGTVIQVPTYTGGGGAGYNSQLTFRNSTADTNTEIQVGPSGPDGQMGSGYGAASVTVLNNVDATNAGYLSLLATQTYTQIDSSSHGSGTRLPLSFRVGGEWRVEIDTGGNVAMARSGANNYSNVNIAHTTPSTSTTTGALQVAGGVGVAGNLHIAGNLTVGGTMVGNNSQGNKIVQSVSAGVPSNSTGNNGDIIYQY